MMQFRVYLRAEIGKLRHRGDAESFIATAPSDLLAQCGLATDPDMLTGQLSTQEAVDAVVAGLTEDVLRRLAQHCSEKWRRNDVYRKLSGTESWIEAEVDVAMIRLQQAEPRLGDLFRKHDYRLPDIARDPVLLSSEPYSQYRIGEPVPYAVCLAIRRGETFRIFDGMHRAIQLFRNGRRRIPVFYPDEGGGA